MLPSITTRVFTADDYDAAVELWQRAEGVEIDRGDDRNGVIGYLQRNPELSRVAMCGPQMVGAVLCGHDGRRGFIYHLAVRAGHRGQGIGKRLVDECVAGLRRCGIQRALILVAKYNPSGGDFWLAQGFQEISNAAPFSFDLV